MTYPNGDTLQERKINQYGLLNCKPKGTPEEQAMTNAAILDELLEDNGLWKILPFAHFKGLQRISRQNRLEQSRSVDAIFFPDQNSEIQSFEAAHASEPELQTVPPDAIFSNQANEIQVYSFDANEMSLPDETDTNDDVVAAQTRQLLSFLLRKDPGRFEAIVNDVRASRTENKAKHFTNNNVKSWTPDPNQALIIPAFIEGTYSFTFFLRRHD